MKKQKSKKKSWFSLIDLIFIVLLAGLVLSVHYFVLVRLRVSNQYMLNLLNEGDFVFLYRSCYGLYNPLTDEMTDIFWGSPTRGDIILFKSEDGGRKVMRILGLPGDKVSYRSGLIFIDSNLIQEPYYRNRSFTVLNPLKLRENIYFVAGDNSALDEYGGNFEIISRNQILGKVLKK
ncbi:MAG TPA: signal peptidase I [Firmicutes bacterium]|nr:signal peptidase I [Bacillota bacterium]